MKHFTEKELASPDTGLCMFNNGFIDKLEQLRIVYGKPMVINSGCRSRAYNKSIGGAFNSYHLYEAAKDDRTGALAIDVRCINGTDKHRLACLAMGLGWSVGVYKNFLHLDRRTDVGADLMLFRGDY